MPGPTTRVLALLELLQAHGRLSGAEIAERLDVDRRTVRRYITALEELGIPVTTEQGRHGGYLLVPGFRLPPLMFTDEEALVLALGLVAAGEHDLAESGPALHSARAKLERVLPPPLQRRLRALRQHTRIIPLRSGRTAKRTILLTLTDAVEAQRRVRMTYCSPQGEDTQRELDPYGLVFRDRYWYVSGYCPLRQALRSFRLDRLSAVAVLAQPFQRPAHFDAAAHLQQSLCNAWRRHEVSVLLHTELATATGCLGDYASLLLQTTGGVRLDTTTDSYAWFACWLQQLPFAFSVIGPPDLKAALQAHARKLLNAC